MSKWEGKFAAFWTRWAGWEEWFDPSIAKAKGDFCRIPGVDHRWFKLFHLSVLWRGSVSRREEFANVSLGPYEEKVRTILLSEDPSPDMSFPVFGTLLLGENGTLRRTRGLMMSPERQRYYGAQLYFWIYSGCEWFYAITDDLNQVEEPLATAMRTLAVGPGDVELPLWVQPHLRSNTLRVACTRRGAEQGAPSFPQTAQEQVVPT